MPPTKKRRMSVSSKRNKQIRNNNEITSVYKQKKSQNTPQTYEVAEILSCRLDPEVTQVSLQFLVSWINYGPASNSWEPLDQLRLNTVFINFINEKFKEFQDDIFVNIANMKEKVRPKREKAIDEDLKVVLMQKVFPFDPFEYKAYQVVYHIMSDPPRKFRTFLEDLVFRNHFFKLDEVQRIKQDTLAKEIAEKEGIPVTIENDVDFECPPNFTYISKNVCSEEILIANETFLNQSTIIEPDGTTSIVTGCKCGKNKCNKESLCCPQLLELPFAYKEIKNTKFVRLNRQEPIIECCDNCSCDLNCLNRVTQQKRDVSLCLFKTENRGWGVKTMTSIKRGVFILEYTGELLGNAEAGKREQPAYLFDLNMDRLTHGFYTIDAFKTGNLARFVNHSCDPNSSMWIVCDCTKNPKNQKLCIFALRNIEKDEEITIDYSPIESVPTTDRMNYSRSYYVECHCGSKACRGTIY